MFDYEGLRKNLVSVVSKYLDCPVVRSNQNEAPPPYPYVSYTITTLMSENKGTYGEYEDGKARKPFTQIWSITALSGDNSESVNLSVKAREWLDHVGRDYLNGKNIIVQSVGSITNRDNFLTAEYEYRNGFDFTLWLYDEVGGMAETETYIDTVVINDEEIDMPKTVEQLNDMLQARLDGDKNGNS